MTAPRKISTEPISPTELEDGDLILDGSLSLVIGEPQTMHTGLGPFDDFQLLIRTELENVADGQRCTRVWALDAVINRQLS
jgi:hypothetical protein